MSAISDRLELLQNERDTICVNGGDYSAIERQIAALLIDQANLSNSTPRNRQGTQ